MRPFLIRSIQFCLLVFATIMGVFLLADGTTDAQYLKFTTPQQQSLIVGSSRAAQGLRPQMLDSILENSKFYNYAFTIHTPYGKTYYESIKKKIDNDTKSGRYILEVNPWLVAKQSDQSSENKLSYLKNTSFVNLNPNFEYLTESFGKSYIHIILNKFREGEYQTFFVHDDGWLEVTIESNMIDREKRTANKMIQYREQLAAYSGVSQIRLDYLKQTIEYLKTKGDVYLLRMPVIDEMLDIEEELIKNFNESINEIALETNINYINMVDTRDKYFYTDGNHLDIISSKEFSIEVSKQIHKLENNN